MPSLKPRKARPLRPDNIMQLAGSTCVEVIMNERASTVKEDVMRLVEAQIMGGVDLLPEEIVDQAFNIVELISRKIYEQH